MPGDKGLLQDLLVPIQCKLALCCTRPQAGDADAVSLQFLAQVPGKTLDGCLAGSVDGQVTHLISVPGAGGGHGQDPGVLGAPEQGDGRLAAEHRAENIGVQLQGNLASGHHLNAPGASHTGVGHQAVDLPIARLDLSEGTADAVTVRHITDHSGGVFTQRLHGLVQTGLIAPQQTNTGA